MMPLCNPVASIRPTSRLLAQLRLVEWRFVCGAYEPNASAQTSSPASSVKSDRSSLHHSMSSSVSSYDNLQSPSNALSNHMDTKWYNKSSVITDGVCDAISQLQSCQLLYSCTKTSLCCRWQTCTMQCFAHHVVYRCRRSVW